MKKLIIALLACVLGATAAQAQKTKAEISAEITTLFPDNTVGAITPLGLRTVTNDIAISIMPTAPVVSGNLACFDGTTGLLQDCGASPTSIYTTLSGDLTCTSLGVCTVTKTNGVAFGALATTVPGTGVAAALEVNVGTAGSPVVNGGALGTPLSGVATNLTGTAAGLTAGTFTAGSASNLTSGTLPAARTNGHMNGTATNDSAAAGEVGEYIEGNIASGSAIAAGTTGVSKNLTSISLTAGDWDVTGMIAWVPAATTQLTAHGASISLVTGTADVTFGRNSLMTLPSAVIGAGNTTNSNVVMTSRFSLSGTTTIYLVGTATYTTSTLNMYGNLRGRRVR